MKGFVLYLAISNGTEEEWAKRIPKILGFIAKMILMKARISKWVATEFFRQGAWPCQWPPSSDSPYVGPGVVRMGYEGT